MPAAEPPSSFDDFVDDLRERLGTADAVKPDELHSFKQLMSDTVVPEQWFWDAYEELQAQGHLHETSGLASRDPHGRLSADGRPYLRTADEP